VRPSRRTKDGGRGGLLKGVLVAGRQREGAAGGRDACKAPPLARREGVERVPLPGGPTLWASHPSAGRDPKSGKATTPLDTVTGPEGDDPRGLSRPRRSPRGPARAAELVDVVNVRSQHPPQHPPQLSGDKSSTYADLVDVVDVFPAPRKFRQQVVRAGPASGRTRRETGGGGKHPRHPPLCRKWLKKRHLAVVDVVHPDTHHRHRPVTTPRSGDARGRGRDAALPPADTASGTASGGSPRQTWEALEGVRSRPHGNLS
jgi:hypothetical protein